MAATDAAIILGAVVLGAVVLGAVVLGAVVLRWLNRDAPAEHAQREAAIPWCRQHRPQIKAEIREREAPRQERVRELAEGVRRGMRGW